jgi:hypothetical protein
MRRLQTCPPMIRAKVRRGSRPVYGAQAVLTSAFPSGADFSRLASAAAWSGVESGLGECRRMRALETLAASATNTPK